MARTPQGGTLLQYLSCCTELAGALPERARAGNNPSAAHHYPKALQESLPAPSPAPAFTSAGAAAAASACSVGVAAAAQAPGGPPACTCADVGGFAGA